MKVIVTGAAGFAGAAVTFHLRQQGIEVYAVVRPGSEHNKRLPSDDPGLHIIPTDTASFRDLPRMIKSPCDICIHLMRTPGKTVSEQRLNVDYALAMTEAAASCGCRRWIGAGSQAEYGIVPPDTKITEEYPPDPLTAYGAAKTASCHLTKIRAQELGMEWIWGRIFSLIGKYEPKSHMLPALYHSLIAGAEMPLSSCRQNWDYLDVGDAADALIALAEKGKPGSIYNIANGGYKPLREFTEQLRSLVAPEAVITYGDDPSPFVSLQPSIEKIKEHTGWLPKRSFEDSIRDYAP